MHNLSRDLDLLSEKFGIEAKDEYWLFTAEVDSLLSFETKAEFVCDFMERKYS